MSGFAPGSDLLKRASILAAGALVAISLIPARQPAAGPVADALRNASPRDRARVASIYEALADVTARDAGQQITTLASWRAVHASALRLAAGGTDLPGKYPGLDVAVDKVLVDSVGSLDDVALSKEVVQKLVAGCKNVVKQSE